MRIGEKFLGVAAAAILLIPGVRGAAEEAAVTLDPAPYVAMLNARAGECYRNIRKTGVDFSGTGTFRLEAGKHRLVIRGREPGARLERLWVGPTGARPETPGGIAIGLDCGKIMPPMELVRTGGNAALVGADQAGEAIYEFTVSAAGAYAVWGKAGGPNAESNSFFIALDDQPAFIWDVPVEAKGGTGWCRVAARGIDYYAAWSLLLSWGAVAPQSRYRNDPDFRRLAMLLTGQSLPRIAFRKVQPAQLWFLQDVEAVRLWQSDPRTPRAVVATMLRDLRPFIDNCYAMAEAENGWRDNTPNIQLQAAAILRLAAEMWRESDPAAATRWTVASEKCIDRAWKWKLPNGPFGYSYGSGVDAGYFSQDAKHLTRLYLLTGNPKIKAALRDMAVAAVNATSYGHPLSFGSPWWKHTFKLYDRGSTFMLVGMILALSGDPLYARLLQLDRQRQLRPPFPYTCDWLIPYYNTMLPRTSVKPLPLNHGGYFSTVENGPALRDGHLNVAMPWRSWCESTCGLAWSEPDRVRSMVCSISLVALMRDGSGRTVKAHYPVAYSIVEQVSPVPEFRAAVCHRDFIASATSFRPALGGPALPQFAGQRNDSPWLRTDIWFADRNGAAGALELRALRANDCTGVKLWAHVSDQLKMTGSQIELPGLTVRFDRPDGKTVNLGRTWGYSAGYYPLVLLERSVKDAAAGFAGNEVFRARVAVEAQGMARLAVASCDVKDDLYRVEIRRGERPAALLLFNRSNAMKSWRPDREYRQVLQSAGADGAVKTLSVGEELSLPAGSLTVLY